MKTEHVVIVVDKPAFVAYRKATKFGTLNSAVVFVALQYNGRRVLVIVPREDEESSREISKGGDGRGSQNDLKP